MEAACLAINCHQSLLLSTSMPINAITHFSNLLTSDLSIITELPCTFILYIAMNPSSFAQLAWFEYLLLSIFQHPFVKGTAKTNTSRLEEGFLQVNRHAIWSFNWELDTKKLKVLLSYVLWGGISHIPTKIIKLILYDV